MKLLREIIILVSFMLILGIIGSVENGASISKMALIPVIGIATYVANAILKRA